jgi:hypothetical protein
LAAEREQANDDGRRCDDFVRHGAFSCFSWRRIFSENRLPHFGIMR